METIVLDRHVPQVFEPESTYRVCVSWGSGVHLRTRVHTRTFPRMPLRYGCCVVGLVPFCSLKPSWL